MHLVVFMLSQQIQCIHEISAFSREALWRKQERRPMLDSCYKSNAGVFTLEHRATLIPLLFIHRSLCISIHKPKYAGVTFITLSPSRRFAARFEIFWYKCNQATVAQLGRVTDSGVWVQRFNPSFSQMLLIFSDI